VGRANGPAIEGYARYEGQSTCDPVAKAGTIALRDLLLARYRGTANYGISRACDIGGTSEHKEGRAFDWGANVNNPAQRAAAENFIAQVLATDAYGHKHALARRMGVMYMIWNSQIWSAYRADAGWQPYSGASPHTDHVHFSLSWAGARAQTSFWSGVIVPGLPDTSPESWGDDGGDGGDGGASGGGGGPWDWVPDDHDGDTSGSHWHATPTSTTVRPTTSTTMRPTTTTVRQTTTTTGP
jgi:hypothetical protein